MAGRIQSITVEIGGDTVKETKVNYTAVTEQIRNTLGYDQVDIYVPVKIRSTKHSKITSERQV